MKLSRDQWLTVVLLLVIVVFGAAFGYLQFLADDDEGVPDLVVTERPYDLQVDLPEGWGYDTDARVDGGYGFASPDYGGITYLRLHQGATFNVIGDWEMQANAADVMQVIFANDWTDPTPIDVLGAQGTYSHGAIDQGQGAGVVHVVLPVDGEPRQYVFIGTVADEWEKWEATFLAMVASARFAES